jgi:two-component system, OmpR family, sensor histidine kinase BaeS
MGMRGGGGMMGGAGQGMMDPLLRSAFGEAVGTALLVGLAAALLIAVAGSFLLATRLARPIDALADASRRIADGDYAQRVPSSDGEIGELATSFNEMAAALEATEQRRRDLIGDVAHELRTPIASVRGYVEGLQAGVFTPGPDAWRVLDEQTTRLERLVDDLALLWQADSRDMRLEIEALDGPALIEAAVERHIVIAASRSIGLARGSVAPVRLLADRVRIAQAIDNLVGNALRYTSPGGSVVLDLVGDHAWAVLSVRDTGSGLSPDQAARVFERFYRGDPSRSREAGGSGLGLAITKSLVEAMGGSVAVASAGAGSGTTFILRLPACNT